MKKFVTAICTLFLLTTLQAQINSGGYPASWSKNISNPPVVRNLNPNNFDFSELRNTDHPKYGGLNFAKVFNVNLNLKKTGTLTQTENLNIWQIKLFSTGAYSLNVIFSTFHIPDNAALYIYSNKTNVLLGAFTSNNNKPFGSLATAPVAGDELIIEYNEPIHTKYPGQIIIGSVAHDYLGVFAKDGSYGDSDFCNIDINCNLGADWQIEKRAVCRLIIEGHTLCSGVLVNNTAQDQTPYILSANHCVNNQYSANHTVFLFNYESPSCNGPDGSDAHSISGADLIATKNQGDGYLDFTLLHLSENIPAAYQPFFAGWDTRTNIPTTSTGIHHPWGDVKKISVDNDPAKIASYSYFDSLSFWQILEWDAGTTEGGSSGSPLFDQNHRVIGTLTGDDGDPNDCEYPVNDFYQMIGAAYERYPDTDEQLKYWLDPLNQHVSYLNGFDPIDQSITNQTVLTHWTANQELAFYEADAGGYLAGNNAFLDRAKAEYFDFNEFENRNAVTGAFIAFVYATGNDDEQIELQILSEKNGYPDAMIGNSTVSLQEIKQKADQDFVYYRFDPPLIVDGSVFASVVLPQNDGDTVALLTVEEAEINTAWEQNYYYNWVPYSNPDSSWGINLAHLIGLEVGNYSSNKIKKINPQISLYPNPTNQVLHFTFDKLPKQFQIYNSMGCLVYMSNTKLTYNYQVNISAFPAGLYIVQITYPQQRISHKLIIE